MKEEKARQKTERLVGKDYKSASGSLEYVVCVRDCLSKGQHYGLT